MPGVMLQAFARIAAQEHSQTVEIITGLHQQLRDMIGGSEGRWEQNA